MIHTNHPNDSKTESITTENMSVKDKIKMFAKMSEGTNQKKINVISNDNPNLNNNNNNNKKISGSSSSNDLKVKAQLNVIEKKNAYETPINNTYLNPEQDQARIKSISMRNPNSNEVSKHLIANKLPENSVSLPFGSKLIPTSTMANNTANVDINNNITHDHIINQIEKNRVKNTAKLLEDSLRLGKKGPFIMDYHLANTDIHINIKKSIQDQEHERDQFSNHNEMIINKTEGKFRKALNDRIKKDFNFDEDL